MIKTTQKWKIGDCIDLMKELESDSIDTIVTSPPYWGLRNYGVDDQIGLEPTLKEYHDRMLEVTAECMRVLKPTGVMFWNMGDSYANVNTMVSEYSIDDEWLRLLGWIYTDGTILLNGSKICIYQTKERGIVEIERLLAVLNLKYSKYGPNKDNYQYYIHASDSRRVNDTLCFNGKKTLPNWLNFCSRRQIIILLQAIINGDGTKRKYDTVVYGIEDRLAPLETLLNKNDISCKLWQNSRGDWLLQIHQELWNPKYFHEKSMVMQNERLIIKMIDDQGWILRNRIIWNKPNGMPSSVTDRFSNRYEPVYMLTKISRYWFDLDAVRIPHIKTAEQYETGAKGMRNRTNKILTDGAHNPRPGGIHTQFINPQNPLGKNPGDVWTIPTQPYKESHFATFPVSLITPLIKAGCPAEICPVCGLARDRIVEKEIISPRIINGVSNSTSRYSDGEPETGTRFGDVSRHTTGWTSCDCGKPLVAGTVLDPFCGSGTVLEVCRKLNRNAIGFELNPEYEDLIRKRSMACNPPLSAFLGD